jgi:hypothetical protein
MPRLISVVNEFESTVPRSPHCFAFMQDKEHDHARNGLKICGLVIRNPQRRSAPHIQVAARVETNAVFVTAPDHVLDALRGRGWKFYTFIGGAGRFMFWWDSKPERIDELCRDLLQCIASRMGLTLPCKEGLGGRRT